MVDSRTHKWTQIGPRAERHSLRDEDAAVLDGNIVSATAGRIDGSTHRGHRRQPSVVDRRRRVSLLNEVLQKLHRQREDDSRVLLGRDGVERLQVAQLERRRRFADDVRSFFQRPRRLLLSLGRYHLTTTAHRERRKSVSNSGG